MNADEVRQLLQQRIVRGLIIFRGSCLVLTLGAAAALILPPSRPWTLSLMLGAWLAYLGWHHVRERYFRVHEVLEDPAIVYWVHASPDVKRDLNDSPETCGRLRLHLRNGNDLDVQFHPSKMRGFLAWLRQNNPSIRWGSYDGLDENEGDQY
jgi:hypothetical protein